MSSVSFVQNDDAKHFSTAMNPCSASLETHSGDVKVLFIGNSITLHLPLPSIGWYGTCGMAASCPENDYVHLVTKGIEEATQRKALLRIKNYALFERHYDTWEPDEAFQEDVDFTPDYLVIALGENVPELDTAEKQVSYRKAFDRLVGAFFHGHALRPLAVVRGVFWGNTTKDSLMACVASDYAIPFVPTSMLCKPEMQAIGLFSHQGVAQHPNDKGMKAMSELILRAFFGDL